MRIGEFVFLGRGGGPTLDGAPHGAWIFRDAGDGRIWSEGSYERGVPCGTWRSYWGHGRLYEQVEIENGLPHGEHVAYAKDGVTVVTRGRFERGRRVGEWSFAHPGGEPAARGAYARGRRHGLWTLWHDDGEREAEIEYDHGRVVRKREWDEWGQELAALAEARCETCRRRTTAHVRDACGAPLCEPCARTDRDDLGYWLCTQCTR